MNMSNQPQRFIAIALLVVSCRSEQETPADTSSMMMDSTMKGMAGMHGDSAMRDMMTRMQGHMGMMDTASAATIQAMHPMHRHMLDSVLTGMNDEMRRRNMASTPEWTALADSLRQDLDRMAGMSASEIPAFMRAHRERMMRLMQMQRTMMGPPRGD
jgi:hypothetical protein